MQHQRLDIVMDHAELLYLPLPPLLPVLHLVLVQDAMQHLVSDILVVQFVHVGCLLQQDHLKQ